MTIVVAVTESKGKMRNLGAILNHVACTAMDARNGDLRFDIWY